MIYLEIWCIVQNQNWTSLKNGLQHQLIKTHSVRMAILKIYKQICYCLVSRLCPTLCDPMDCSPARLFCPGKNTGVNFPSLGDCSHPETEPSYPALQAVSLGLKHLGSQYKQIINCLKWNLSYSSTTCFLCCDLSFFPGMIIFPLKFKLYSSIPLPQFSHSVMSDSATPWSPGLPAHRQLLEYTQTHFH